LTRIDSEIALTALLASLVTAYPTPDLWLYSFVKGAAIGLLAMTLGKRVGLISGLSSDDWPMRLLAYAMDFTTTVTILYCCYAALRTSLTWVNIGPQSAVFPLVFSVGTPVLVIMTVVVSELIFGDLLGEGERVFAASATQHQGEAMGWYLRQVSEFVGEKRTADPTTHQSKLTDWQFSERTIEDLSEEELEQHATSITIFYLSVGFVLLGYLLLPIVTVLVFGQSWFLAGLLLLAVVTVDAIVRLWYSTYGLLKIENRNGWVTYVETMGSYAVAVLLLT
jgi:hypothetical protein